METTVKFLSIGTLFPSIHSTPSTGVDSYLDEFFETVVLSNFHSTVSGIASNMKRSHPDGDLGFIYRAAKYSKPSKRPKEESILLLWVPLEGRWRLYLNKVKTLGAIPKLNLRESEASKDFQTLIDGLLQYDLNEGKTQKAILKKLYEIFVQRRCGRREDCEFTRSSVEPSECKSLLIEASASKIREYPKAIDEFCKSVLMKIPQDQKIVAEKAIDLISYFNRFMDTTSSCLDTNFQELCRYDQSCMMFDMEVFDAVYNLRKRFALDVVLRASINLLRLVGITMPELLNECKLEFLFEFYRIYDHQTWFFQTNIERIRFNRMMDKDGCMHEEQEWHRSVESLKRAAANRNEILKEIQKITEVLNPTEINNLVKLREDVKRCCRENDSLLNKLTEAYSTVAGLTEFKKVSDGVYCGMNEVEKTCREISSPLNEVTAIWYSKFEAPLKYLKKSTIAALKRRPPRQYMSNDSKYDQCAICLAKLFLGNAIIEYPCQHLFDFWCAIRWLKKSDFCPCCRRSFSDDQPATG